MNTYKSQIHFKLGQSLKNITLHSIELSAMEDNSLKQADEARINTVFTNFGKTQTNIMKYSEVIMMLLDRCVFNHKFTFSNFQQIFENALNVTNKKKLEKDSLQGQKILGKEQFIFLLNQIAKILFRPLPNYQQKFYSEFLSQKFDISDGQFHTARVPSFDDVNKKLFMQQCVSTLSKYEIELKNIYLMYIIQNHLSMKKSRRLLLSQRQVVLQNKKWTFPSIILYLKQSQTTPHLITIDHVEQILRQIVPHVNNKQQQFYSRHVIVDTYHKEAEQNEKTAHAGDPGLYFHEFLILIARLAWETFPKQIQKKSTQQVLERYFNYTFFRSNDNIQKKTIPQMNRKMLKKMVDFYKIIESESRDKEQPRKQSFMANEPAINTLIQRINNQVIKAPSIGLDFAEIAKALQKQLPKLPPVPVIIPEGPPPYNKADAITIGQQPPPQPVDKDKGAKVEKKSGGGKKDEIPPRVFQWGDVPSTKYAAQDHLKSIQHKITFEVKPLTDIERGQIRKQSNPVLIGETLFPGQLPKKVVPHLKQASQALNNRNFILALQCYEKGIKQWKNTQVEFDSVAELFFQYSKGNIYLSVGQVQYALQAFYGCRRLSDTSRLPFINPDRSLPYFGIGEVLYEMQEYQLAARSFLKSRQIRQSVLGLEHVQTATVFNNLACCFFMLGRAHEALGYIQIAQVILDTQMGQLHERTMVSRSNLKKITHGSFTNEPEYRKFWEVFETDKFEGKKKKKKEKQGKKK